VVVYGTKTLSPATEINAHGFFDLKTMLVTWSERIVRLTAFFHFEARANSGLSKVSNTSSETNTDWLGEGIGDGVIGEGLGDGKTVCEGFGLGAELTLGVGRGEGGGAELGVVLGAGTALMLGVGEGAGCGSSGAMYFVSIKPKLASSATIPMIRFLFLSVMFSSRFIKS